MISLPSQLGLDLHLAAQARSMVPTPTHIQESETIFIVSMLGKARSKSPSSFHHRNPSPWGKKPFASRGNACMRGRDVPVVVPAVWLTVLGCDPGCRVLFCGRFHQSSSDSAIVVKTNRCSPVMYGRLSSEVFSRRKPDLPSQRPTSEPASNVKQHHACIALNPDFSRNPPQFQFLHLPRRVLSANTHTHICTRTHA